jgi:outer membrane lipoprotein-sorting protein
MFISFFATLIALCAVPQTPSGSQPVTVRDPQAVASLTQMLSATGWGTVQAQDVVGTGMVTRDHGDYQDTVGIRVESSGPRLFRSDVQDPSGAVTTILNGDGAAVITASSAQLLPSYVAIAMRPSAFPFFGGFLSFLDNSYSIKYDGVETIAGQAAYRIEFVAPPGGSDPTSQMRSKVNQLTVWVSVATAYPVQVAYRRISNNNPNASRQITQTFSDYRTVGGIQVPFHQEEYASGRMILSLQLSAVNLNTGVPSTDYALPAVQN